MEPVSEARSGQQILIAAQGLSKRYERTQAVADVSFEVARGQVVGFLGPNGAGKSTTMKMLTGFLRPSAGRAVINGHDVSVDGLLARRSLGYLPEQAPLYDDMMVIDFLRFIGKMRDLEPDTLRKRMREVIERCGLGDVLGKDIAQLSKGFRQRVGLAQALLHDPDLLILDEPTSGLDPNQIVEIRALIRDLGRDKTVLLSTHILSEVQAVCSRAIIINQGRIIADDRPDRIGRSREGQQIVLRLRARAKATIDRALVRAKLSQVSGIEQVDVDGTEGELVARVLNSQATDVREALFDIAVGEGWVIVGMQQQERSLEEVFQLLTRRKDVSEGDRHAA